MPEFATVAEAVSEYQLDIPGREACLIQAELAAGVETWEWALGDNMFRYLGEPDIFRSLGVRTYQDWLNSVHPDDRDRAHRLVQDFIQSPVSSYINDYRVVMHDGSVRYISTRGRMEFNSDGKPVRMLGANIDITEQKNTIDALRDHIRRQAEAAKIGKAALRGETLPGLMDRIAAVIVEILHVEFCKVLEWHPEKNCLLLCSGVGWRPGLVGKACVPDGKESQAGYTLHSGGPVIVEDLATETRFTGPWLLSEHGVSSGVSVVIQGVARPWGVLGAHTRSRRLFTQEDVIFIQTMAIILAEAIERKTYIDNLRRSEMKFRGLLESAPDGVVISNVNGKIESINESLEKMTGYLRQELVGKPVEILVPARYTNHSLMQTEFLKNPHVRLMGRDRQVLSVLRKDGSEFPAEISLVPLTLDSGIIVSTTIRDISERIKAEHISRQTHERLRSLTARIHAAREEERTRVAREIHDELGQTLTGLKMDLYWIQERMPQRSRILAERARSMLTLVESTIDFVRNLATSLRPAILDDLGLDAAIEWQIQGFASRTGCAYTLDLTYEDIEANSIRDTTIFRIFQEAVTNIARHSRADHVNVTLRRDDGQLVLTVTDNGIGIEPHKLLDNQSLGLIGMRERAAELGGELRIESESGHGTQITLFIPLSGKQSEPAYL